MKFKIVIACLIVLMPFTSHAQDTNTAHKHKKTAKKGVKLPAWAAAHNYDATTHAYFPDYYTFYDPNRGGYVYWDQGTWSFTPTVPPYLANVDLNKSRVQLLKGLSLDLHPETNYPYYMELYPPDPNNNVLVPVPTLNNPAGN